MGTETKFSVRFLIFAMLLVGTTIFIGYRYVTVRAILNRIENHSTLRASLTSGLAVIIERNPFKDFEGLLESGYSYDAQSWRPFFSRKS